MSTPEQETTPAGAGVATAGRRPRAKVTGVVISDRMTKTITVQQERLVKHPKYGKYLRRYSKYKAHDERGEAHVGDTVEIVQTRPLSKTKSWRLVRVITKAPEA